MTSTSQMRELAQRWGEASENRDRDAMRSLLADDFVYWLNAEGKEKSANETADVSRYEDSRGIEVNVSNVRERMCENGWVRQDTIHVTRPEFAEGEAMVIHRCFVFTVDGDKIQRLEEYIDLSPYIGTLTGAEESPVRLRAQ